MLARICNAMSFLFSRATHSTKHDALQLALMLRLGSDRSMLLSVEMGSQLLCALSPRAPGPNALNIKNP